jgi:AmmeMemoRadiSam system protein B
MQRKASVRRSIIAGQWYPGQPERLRQTIDGFLGNVTPRPSDGQAARSLGLIVPHAGYTYSGQTAAYAYRRVQGASYGVVAIISPLHRLPLGRFAIISADAYETPLGLVNLDAESVAALSGKVQVNRVGRDDEHAIEIQLPFLQVALGEFGLLPVMIGESSFEAGEELGLALAEVLEGQKALIVASTDLHHIPDYDEVVRRDQVVIDAIASFDRARIKEVLSPWDCSVCGRVPIYAMLTAAKALGADKVEILHHTNSGDVTGVRTPGQYTVGYLAAAVYKDA